MCKMQCVTLIDFLEVFEGAKVHSIREVIVEHVKESLAQLQNFDASKDKIQIKVSGDGAEMTRKFCFDFFFYSSTWRISHVI